MEDEKRKKISDTKPENLTSDACIIFDEDPNFKKEYEKKWGIEIDCID